ncbi:hypothetical protein [Pseudomonas abietaniphila]|uniref:Uncharacterized protein n=1 Tax=Pseudomonas abietaniphila TaxID=89065 RepID=A0A1G8T8R3_9PSED|nr:hypothetical protein [Pseudomonas abietaniphila]SDJ37898.1 hypothetical protein SAMN05216605_1283 [Pseudomonas abietaniphila]
MLKYSEISARYAEYRREQNEYWDHLQKAAYQLLHDLGTALELPSKTWKNAEGSVSGYVDIGLLEGGVFKRVHPMEFKGNDLQYDFTIRMTLEEGPDDLSKAFYFQNISMKAAADRIIVTVKGARRDQDVDVSKSISDGQFHAVVELIAARLFDALSLKLPE